MKRRALLLAKMDPPEKNEVEWNKHYNEVHVEDRRAIPGFLSARRYIKIEGVPKLYSIPGDAKYLALYNLESVAVLNAPAYRRVWDKDHAQPADSFEARIFQLPKFARGVYDQIFPENDSLRVEQSKYVLLVGHEIPRGKAGEFNAWYNTEHIPLLRKVPGVLNIRRFEVSKGEAPPMTSKGGIISRYMTVWDVEDPSGFGSETFRKASASPWSQWVRSWYTRKICCLYKQIYPD